MEIKRRFLPFLTLCLRVFVPLCEAKSRVEFRDSVFFELAGLLVEKKNEKNFRGLDFFTDFWENIGYG